MRAVRPGTAAAPDAVVTLTGYGITVRVERGQLVTESGIADQRETRRFGRLSGLRRLVVTGHAGSVTLDALRWLTDVHAAFVHLGHDGDVFALGTPRELRDATVRRGQALAPYTGVAVDLARTLLDHKLAGQAAVLATRGGTHEARAAIEAARAQLPACATVEQLRFAESRAAAAYWDALGAIAVRFPAKEAARVPAHWQTVGARQSVLSASPRKATTPAHAVWNYVYAVLEAEARLALLAVGCDPVLGLLHADRQGRASLAFDLMEPVRPAVDAYVLQLLDAHTFTRDDVFETREGVCRLLPPLLGPLTRTAARWRRLLAPHAEWLATALAGAAERPPQFTPGTPHRAEASALRRTPLTGAKRRRPTERAPAAAMPPAPDARPPRRCRRCGTDLGVQHRQYCPTCLPVAAAEASRTGVAAQQQLRAVGDDRRSHPEHRAQLRAAATRQAEAERAWAREATTIPAPREYDETLAPALRDVPAAAIVAATGLTPAAAKAIRAGRMRPHPRHWDALRALVASLGAEEREAWRALPDTLFAEQLAPVLPRLSAEALQEATGLSHSYCRRMRAGHHVPHRRHWPALLSAVECADATRNDSPHSATG